MSNTYNPPRHRDASRTPQARRATIARRAARHLKVQTHMSDAELSALKIGGAL